MARRTNTIPIPLGLGGISGNFSDVQPRLDDMVTSRNWDNRSGLLTKRFGSAVWNNTAPISNPLATITGLYSFRSTDNTQKEIAGTFDGRFLRVQPTTYSVLVTGATSSVYWSFADMNGYVFAANGVNMSWLWDGVASTAGGISAPPTDWTGTRMPKQVVRHNNRLWVIATGSNTVYFSKMGDGGNWTAANDAGSLVVGYGAEAVALIEFKGVLMCFTADGVAYAIDDSSATIANWSVSAVYGKPGEYPAPISWRAITTTLNDVLFIGRNGHVYSVSAIQAHSSYALADLMSRPESGNYFHSWVSENVDLSNVLVHHLFYDADLNSVLAFYKRKGAGFLDTAAVYYPVLDRWLLFGGDGDGTGPYSAYSVARFGSDLVSGTSAGRIWKLNQDSAYDGAIPITASCQFVDWFVDGRQRQHFTGLWVYGRADNTVNLSYSVKVDDVVVVTGTLTFVGIGSVFPITFDNFILGGAIQASRYIPIGAYGRKASLSLTNAEAIRSVAVFKFVLDAKPVGKENTGYNQRPI